MDKEALLRGVHRLTRVVQPDEVAADFQVNVQRNAWQRSAGRELMWLDKSSYSSLAPSWLSRQAYIDELGSFNGIPFWKSLISHHDDVVAGFVAGMDRNETIPGFGAYIAAGYISASNERFFQATVGMIGMVALFGNRWEEVYGDIVNTSTSANAIEKLGNLFEGIADSPEELFARLQTLFPPRVADKKVAFDSLNENGAFNHFRVKEQKTMRCPAVEVTRVIFDTYGDMLQDPDYKVGFMKRVLL